MAQDVKVRQREWEGEVTPLGQWLPKERGFSKFINRELLFVFVFMSFTVLVIVSTQFMPQGLNWLKVGLIFVVSTAFGGALAFWWEKSVADKKNRVEALRIDQWIEEEMQRISENWQQTILAISTLVNRPQPEFIRATQFLLGNQQNYVESSLQRYALEISRLGFDAGSFLDEKFQRHTQTKMRVLRVLKTMPRDTALLLEIFNTVDPQIFALPSYRAERDLEGQLNG